MCYVCPGNAIDTRQTFKRLACKLGQVSVIVARQAFLNLLKLRFYQVKVVKQPFSCRRYVLTTLRNSGDVVIRASQGNKIFLYARKKRKFVAPAFTGPHDLGLRQTSSMFFKALDTKKFGTDKRFGAIQIAFKNFSGVWT